MVQRRSRPSFGCLWRMSRQSKASLHSVLYDASLNYVDSVAQKHSRLVSPDPVLYRETFEGLMRASRHRHRYIRNSLNRALPRIEEVLGPRTAVDAIKATIRGQGIAAERVCHLAGRILTRGGYQPANIQKELEDNALGLNHQKLGLFDQVMKDITVDHPDGKGIDGSEQDADEEDEESEEGDEE
jgi:hypothetical protein